MSPHSPRPANLLSVFQAHFHVKRGNEITHQYGHEVDLTGVEWSVLPSGSHTLDDDLIWFVPPAASMADAADDGNLNHHRIGVAVFKNRRLTSQQEQQSGEELDQRGARMIAVGVIALCHDSSAFASLAACLPHIEALSKLAEASSLDPSNTSILDSFLDGHRFSHESLSETVRSLQDTASQRSPHLFSRQPLNVFDPILDLPAIANALGLVLPDVLRTLLSSSNRLLIFTPTGANTSTAASLAWNLAEILQGALNGQEEEDDDEDEEGEDERAPRNTSRPSGPCMRGILSLQDITRLEDEEKIRAESRLQRQRHAGQHRSSLTPTHSWIAYTTDKLYLEKAHLYDYLLDLTPLCAAAAAAAATTAPSIASSSSGPSSSRSVLSYCQTSTPGSSPLFSRVERPAQTQDTGTGQRQRNPVKLKQQAWHPRDFAIYRANELRCVRLASRPRSLVRRSSRSSIAVRSAASDDGFSGSGATISGRPEIRSTPSGTKAVSSVKLPRISSPGAFLSTLLAFLRYYLSSLWFIPRQWRINLRESYGYVPLSIRPDGGVQAGLMILPDSESESDGEDGSGSESGDSSFDDEDDAGPRRLRVPSPLAEDDDMHTLEIHGQPSQPVVEASPRRSRSSTSRDRRTSEHSHSHLVSPNHSDFEIDPILAACGAGPSSAAASRRLSIAEQSGATTKDALAGSDRVDSSGGEDSELTDSTVTLTASSRRRSTAAAGSSSTDEQYRSSPLRRDADLGRRTSRSSKSAGEGTNSVSRRRRSRRQEDYRDALLARAIFTIWSEWLCELILDLDRLSEGNVSVAPLASRDLSAIGLNSSNKRDRELVADWTGRQIQSTRWWSSLGLGAWL